MGFSHLFILQLRSWHRGLGPPDLDSGPYFFDLLFLLFPSDSASTSLGLSAGADTPKYVGFLRRCNSFMLHHLSAFFPKQRGPFETM